MFCCDHNAVRSPMAEALAKLALGTTVFIQSAGVKSEMEVDGFAAEVIAELGLDIGGHRVKSFGDLESWGEEIEAFDLIIALSPAAQRKALDYTRYAALEVEYWPTLDPTGLSERREQKLDDYRQTRDQLAARIKARFNT